MTTDASLIDWGGLCEDMMASGKRALIGPLLHFNMLELQAVFLCLKRFLPRLSGEASPNCTTTSREKPGR